MAQLDGQADYSAWADEDAMTGLVDPATVSNPFLVETISLERLRRHESEWADLAGRALERNVFIEPSFALAFLQHVRRPRNLLFLLVWRKANDAPDRLMALWPLVAPGAPETPYETWRHEYCCLGAPLLDGVEAAACLDAIVSHLRAEGGASPMLSLGLIRRRGPLFSLVAAFAAQAGLAIASVAQTKRAALDATETDRVAADSISSKKRKELRRLLRRLHETGDISFGIADEGEALSQHIESFLALEAKGWKGRRGGALLARPERAAFARAMLRGLAHHARCRIYWLACGERVIASNILLLDGDKAYFWKTAYDEDFAAFSPGVLLTLHMTDALLRDPRLSRIDSCAVPNHPMIDHVWRDQEPFADIMLACRPAAGAALRGAVRRERFRRWLRDQAKSLLSKARR
ncbi:GNAT family N-acetyltransferase [Rhodoblastus sp.]|uniref:GNAT family N-acetyltransferase n=2 Tax=Rhodoblastus sp. TaxID=1962975 RepID=UPI003F9696D9